MKITYDPEADALYIRLTEEPAQCRTLRISDEVALNLGAHEELVGIEILEARRLSNNRSWPDIILENIPLEAVHAAIGPRPPTA